MKIDRSKIKSIQHRIAVLPKDHFDSYFGNESSEYCYLPLLKNAHLWGMDFFRKYANFKPIQNYKDKKYIIFLRDPIKRWISATAQWFDLNHVGSEEYVIDTLMMKMIFSVIRLDGHGYPQHEQLSHINIRNATFFDLDNPSFEINLKHFLNENKICRFSKLSDGKRNTTEKNNFKLSITSQLQKALEDNPYYLEQLIKFYNKDIKFVQSCTFYEPFK